MGTYFYSVILFLAWSAYLYLHSFLASTAVKNGVSDRFPSLARGYRLLYSIQSTVGLLALLYLMGKMPADILFERSESVKAVGFSLGGIGVLVISLAFRNFSAMGFLGIGEERNLGLIRSGIHGRIRHPIYTGTILILIGFTLAVPTVTVAVSTLAVFAYLPVGIRWEEQKLLELFGEEYEQYKKEVPALFPLGF